MREPTPYWPESGQAQMTVMLWSFADVVDCRAVASKVQLLSNKAGISSGDGRLMVTAISSGRRPDLQDT